MRRRRAGLQVSTFPFLAVLLCAMGSLILLLLVIDRRAKIVARHRALEEARLVDDTEIARRKEEWERQRQKLHALLAEQQRELHKQLLDMQDKSAVASQQLHDERARFGKSEQAVSRIKIELEQLKTSVARRRTAFVRASQDAQKSQQATQQAMEQLARELGELERTLAALRLLRRRQEQAFSLVPYAGKRGDTRKPIYVECTQSGLTFYPEPRTIPERAINSGQILAEIERRSKARDRAYLLFLVRPEGITSYTLAQNSLRRSSVDYGYELVEADWIFDFSSEERLASLPWRQEQAPIGFASQGPGILAPPRSLPPALTPQRSTQGAGYGQGMASRPGSSHGTAGAPQPFGSALAPIGEGAELPQGSAGPGFGQSAGPNPGGWGTGWRPGGKGSAGTGFGLSAWPSAGGASGGLPEGMEGEVGSGRRQGDWPGGDRVATGLRTGTQPGVGSGGEPTIWPNAGGTGAGLRQGTPGADLAFGNDAVSIPPYAPSSGSPGVPQGTLPLTSSQSDPGNIGTGQSTGVPRMPWDSDTGARVGDGHGASSMGRTPGSHTIGEQVGNSTSGGGTPSSRSSGGNPQVALGDPSAVPGAGQGYSSNGSHSAAVGPGASQAAQQGAPTDTSAVSGPWKGQRPVDEPATSSPHGKPGAAEPMPGQTGGPPVEFGAPADAEGNAPGVPQFGGPRFDLPKTKTRPMVPLSRMLGNRDYPIVLECNADAIVIQPWGIRYDNSALPKRPDPGHPLVQTIGKLIARRQATVRQGEPPYRAVLRFQIRPGGLRSYYLAYPMLESLHLPMTRENVGDELEGRR